MTDYTTLANSIAGDYGIPANIFSAVIGKESSWNLRATNVNSNGSVDMGLGQINSKTADAMGLNYGSLLSDASYNLKASAQILSDNFKRFGNWTKALSAYNTGSPDSLVGTIYASNVLNASGDIVNGIPVSGGAAMTTDMQKNADASTAWMTTFWDDVKNYVAPIGLIALAIVLIYLGLAKAIK